MPPSGGTFIQHGLSRFAGRELDLDMRVYQSEAASNQRNESIARLLDSYQRLGWDPVETTDVYTRQCSLSVTTRDLAVMGATLADGGVNPVTGERVVDPRSAATRWPPWPPPACMSAAATGSTRSACRARAACPVAS